MLWKSSDAYKSLTGSPKLNSSSWLNAPFPATISKGEILFTEGDPCTGLFVIESGHVRIFKSSPNGREQILTVEGPGSSIAELPLFDGGNYPASSAAWAMPEFISSASRISIPCAWCIPRFLSKS